MTFNFQNFVDELREDETERKNIIEYENFFGTIKGGIEDQIWYREYVSRFDCSDFYQADKIIQGVEVRLIYQLIAASCSVSIDIRKNNNLLEIGLVNDDSNMYEIKIFTVSNYDIRFVSEFSDSQISELLKIAFQEQIIFQILYKKYETEVDDRREKRINSWEKKLALFPTIEYVSSIESEILSCLS